MENIGEEFTSEERVKDIKPLIRYANLSGRSKRKLERQNTVHLKGVCPKCGAYGMRFKKDIYYKGMKNPEHNKWLCAKCGFRASRDQLKYIKYD